jgi:hypothetical protein
VLLIVDITLSVTSAEVFDIFKFTNKRNSHCEARYLMNIGLCIRLAQLKEGIVPLGMYFYV